MPVVNKPFSSQFGFTSPNFTVDEQGNIIATSIQAAGAGGSGGTQVTDYSFTDEIGYYQLNGEAAQNPSLALTRVTRFTFNLELTENTFSIFSDDLGTLYNTGLQHTHDDGVITTGAAAQGNTDGVLQFTVPADAPDTLYYGDVATGLYNIITITDAAGQFGDLVLTSTTAATSGDTGALVVKGGAGIGGDIFVDGKITTNGVAYNGVGISNITSNTNLELDAANKIVIKNNSSFVGEINSTGLSIPINTSNITESTINNTTIGATTPSTATFTSADVNNVLTTKKSVANKGYVDKTAVAFSVAFGL
jgi:hypothetical protein|tara:strand:+ start:20773 stop:21693 length:921 start_codon:yes stop_codon:yes gene_type:complete